MHVYFLGIHGGFRFYLRKGKCTLMRSLAYSAKKIRQYMVNIIAIALKILTNTTFEAAKLQTIQSKMIFS